jgi:hypothetical protein
MARKRDTDEGDPYGAADEAEVADAIERAEADAYLADMAEWAEEDEGAAAGPGDEEPGPAEEGEEPEPEPRTATIDVKAQIEWAGTIDHPDRDNGVRRTRMDGVPLNGIGQDGERFGPGILDAARDLRTARQTGPDQPYRSYQRKGWQAQLRQALSTKRGREAVQAAGLNPDTIRRWQKGTQAPGNANRAKIADMYGRLRDPRSAAVQNANHGMAEALTAALRERYGVTIRLRHIEHLHIEPED